MHGLLHNKNRLGAALALAGGLALGAYSLIGHAKAPVQTTWALSPYLFPLLLSVFALLLSLALLLEGRGAAEEKKPPQDWKKPGAVLLLSILFCALLPLLHFVPASALYLAALLFLLGERRQFVILAVALLLPLALYALFGLGLHVRLP